MTGSFLFVKPSDPEGKIGTAYSDPDKPRYPYDHASWEWLLERTIRRTLIPWALTKSHSRELLASLEDKYSMHRWGSYGVSYPASITPTAYQSVGGPGSSGRKTDADLSSADRVTSTELSSETKVTYGVVDLEEAVANLPFAVEWLHPDWASSDLNAWDLSAETTETTNGSGSMSYSDIEPVWTWNTAVEHTPYNIPDAVPFKCLSHMRTDDDLVTVKITNDDNEAIEVETAPTPMHAPRTTDGSIDDFHGSQVRVAAKGAAYYAGWSLSEFYIQHIYGLDYGPSTSSYEYGRDGKTSESYTVNDSTLGCLVDIPDKDEYIAVSQGKKNYEWAGFIHDVNWGDKKQTWWHANGFPKGLDSVLSRKLKTQLKTLCPVCQPAIPPAVPAFLEKFPAAGHLPWGTPSSELYPQGWMQHLALACTPLDMSARLDATTTTVHRVPTLFAKIKTVTTEYSTSLNVYIDGNGQSRSMSTFRKEVTVEGVSSNPIPTGDDLKSVSGKASGVNHWRNSTSAPWGSTSSISETQDAWEESFESNSDFLVCLRSTDNTTMSTEVTTKYSETFEPSYGDPSSSETESSYGELPDSYDPNPDDLLFPDWVLPWIKTAELFAYVESRLGRKNNADRTELTNYYVPARGEGTSSYSGIGNGSRTHKTRRKIVSLGLMDTSTGRFPALDAAAVLSKVDPGPDDPTGGFGWSSRSGFSTNTTDEEGNRTSTDISVSKGDIHNYRSRSVSYYVVVKWNFDRLKPDTLATDSSLADLYRKLADAKKVLSDKKRELSDAESALSDAESALSDAESTLTHAQEQLSDPEGAEPVLLAEAQAKLDLANKKLSDAQSEKSYAQSEYESAENNMGSANSSLQSAQEAYDAAVTAGEGVEEARAALESAYTAYFESVEQYNKASSRLANAESDEAMAQLTADAAQDYYDTLHNKIEEILQKAVDDAQAAVDEATSRVNEWEQKVSEIEGEIPILEAAVEAAEAAVEAAKKEVAVARASVT